MEVLEKISDAYLSKVNALGYYLGSFDPLHTGHIEVVKIIMQKKLCDAVFVYCVNGNSSYKKRSNFITRTEKCESAFEDAKNVIISYMGPRYIQNRFTIPKNGWARLKFEHMKITGIIGSDIALGLEHVNHDKDIENARILRQQDFMQGHIISNDFDSLACSICLPASDFIVALRNNHVESDIPRIICGRSVRAIVDTHKFRFLSSSNIKHCSNQKPGD